MKKTSKKWVLTTFLALIMFPITSFAQCSISASTFNVGSYNPLSASSITVSDNIVVNCQKPQGITLLASGGNSGNPNIRFFLNQDNEKLYYNIYLNSEGSSILGDGISTGQYMGKNGNITFYLKIPPKQNVGIGQYHDNLTINVDF